MSVSEGEESSTTEIEPGLFIGNWQSSMDMATLIQRNITAMVSLGAQRAGEWDRAGNRKLVAEEDHLFVRCDDQATEDILSRVPDICDFIDAHLHAKQGLDMGFQAEQRSRTELTLAEQALPSYAEGQSVLIHCKLGLSR